MIGFLCLTEKNTPVCAYLAIYCFVFVCLGTLNLSYVPMQYIIRKILLLETMGFFPALLVLSEKCQVTSIFHDPLLSNCARSIAPQSPQPISPKLSIFILVPSSNSEESEINEAAQNALDEYQSQGNPSNQLHAVDLANQI